MTLRQYRLDLGWTTAKLAEMARISRQAASAAERGSSIQADTAKAIADALSKAYEKEIKSWEIEGLDIL